MGIVMNIHLQTYPYKILFTFAMEIFKKKRWQVVFYMQQNRATFLFICCSSTNERRVGHSETFKESTLLYSAWSYTDILNNGFFIFIVYSDILIFRVYFCDWSIQFVCIISNN